MRIWDRFTFDATYELSYVRQSTFVDAYRHEPSTGRASSAAVLVDRGTGNHGLGLSVAYSLSPFVGVGIEGSVHEDTSTPEPDTFLERVGVRLGARRIWGVGILTELRPWQDSIGLRDGWYFRGGLRALWLDYRWVKDSRVVEPSSEWGRDVMVVLGPGYRVAAGAGLSLSIQGLFKASFEGIGLGAGLGGVH
ncbi:MAG: hypothetical protein ACOC1F_00440 [Myxococcota bacterium]